MLVWIVYIKLNIKFNSKGVLKCKYLHHYVRIVVNFKYKYTIEKLIT